MTNLMISNERQMTIINNIGGNSAEKTASLLDRVFESTQDGIMITDVDNNILAVNPAFSAVTGYTPEEAIGQNPRILKSGLHTIEFYQNLWDSLIKTGQWQGEIWDRRKNGEIYPEWVNISVIKDAEGNITNYVAIFSDITTLKLSENRLDRLAHHDALTGLPNLLLFQDRLKQALAQSYRNERMVAVLFIDLDRFKPVNDTYGHRTGDRVLQAVAERLTDSVREGDTVARVGGDEFTVIVANISNANDSVKIAQKILDVLSQPFMIEGHKLQISASIGISLYPANGQDIDELVRNADIAMYHAKKQGGNNYQFYLKP
ncbi:MAG: diguanylate cyclase [Acidobacteriota bacterium]